MEWIWLGAITVAIVVLFAVASSRKQKSERILLFRQRDNLFTAAERSFLGVLDQASSGRYRVFGKVRIADVLAPAKGLDKGTWRTVFNRINAKHFDFVLCDPQTLQVKAVIELNDKSHTNSRRIERDELIGRACAEAGLALRVIKAQRNYSVEAVKQTINEIDMEIRVESEGDHQVRNGRTPSS